MNKGVIISTFLRLPTLIYPNAQITTVLSPMRLIAIQLIETKKCGGMLGNF